MALAPERIDRMITTFESMMYAIEKILQMPSDVVSTVADAKSPAIAHNQDIAPSLELSADTSPNVLWSSPNAEIEVPLSMSTASGYVEGDVDIVLSEARISSSLGIAEVDTAQSFLTLPLLIRNPVSAAIDISLTSAGLGDSLTTIRDKGGTSVARETSSITMLVELSPGYLRFPPAGYFAALYGNYCTSAQSLAAVMKIKVASSPAIMQLTTAVMSPRVNSATIVPRVLASAIWYDDLHQVLDKGGTTLQVVHTKFPTPHQVVPSVLPGATALSTHNTTTCRLRSGVKASFHPCILRCSTVYPTTSFYCVLLTYEFQLSWLGDTIGVTFHWIAGHFFSFMRIWTFDAPTVASTLCQHHSNIPCLSAIIIHSKAFSAITSSSIVLLHNVCPTVVSLGVHTYFSNSTTTTPSIRVLESANMRVFQQNQMRTTQLAFHAIAALTIQIFGNTDHFMDKGGTVAGLKENLLPTVNTLATMHDVVVVSLTNIGYNKQPLILMDAQSDTRQSTCLQGAATKQRRAILQLVIGKSSPVLAAVYSSISNILSYSVVIPCTYQFGSSHNIQDKGGTKALSSTTSVVICIVSVQHHGGLRLKSTAVPVFITVKSLAPSPLSEENDATQHFVEFEDTLVIYYAKGLLFSPPPAMACELNTMVAQYVPSVPHWLLPEVVQFLALFGSVSPSFMLTISPVAIKDTINVATVLQISILLLLNRMYIICLDPGISSSYIRAAYYFIVVSGCTHIYGCCFIRPAAVLPSYFSWVVIPMGASTADMVHLQLNSRPCATLFTVRYTAVLVELLTPSRIRDCNAILARQAKSFVDSIRGVHSHNLDGLGFHISFFPLDIAFSPLQSIQVPNGIHGSKTWHRAGISHSYFAYDIVYTLITKEAINALTSRMASNDGATLGLLNHSFLTALDLQLLHYQIQLLFVLDLLVRGVRDPPWVVATHQRGQCADELTTVTHTNSLIKLQVGYVVPWVMWQRTPGIGHVLIVNRLARCFLELLVDSFLRLNSGRTRTISAEPLPSGVLVYIEQRDIGFSAGLHCRALTLPNIFQFFIFLVAAMNLPLCGPSLCDLATESYVQYGTLLWHIAWLLSLYPIMTSSPVQCELTLSSKLAQIFLQSISRCAVFIFPSATYYGEYRTFVESGMCGSADIVHREAAYHVGFLLLKFLYEAYGLWQSDSCIHLIFNVRMHIMVMQVSCNATRATRIVSMAAHALITHTRVLLDVNSSHSTGEQLKFYYMLLSMLNTIVLYLWTCCDRLGFVVVVLNSPNSSRLLYTNMLQHMEAMAVWTYHQFFHLQCVWLYEAMVAVINKSLVIYKAASVQCAAPILILYELFQFISLSSIIVAEPLYGGCCLVGSECCSAVTHYVNSTPNQSRALRGLMS